MALIRESQITETNEINFDTTDNKFRDDLLIEPLNIQEQVANNFGKVAIPEGPGLGVEPDRDFIKRYSI